MNRLKQSVQRLRVHLLKKRFSQSVVDIGKNLDNCGRVLLLLPCDSTLRKNLLGYAAAVGDLFPSSEICIVSTSDDEVREFARREGFKSFAPNRLEMSWYGFPNKSFFNRIRNLKGNVLIDLDSECSCFNAAVSVVSEAPLRIGLFGVWGPPVHNVEIKPSLSADRSDGFRDFLRVLSSLIN